MSSKKLAANQPDVEHDPKTADIMKTEKPKKSTKPTDDHKPIAIDVEPADAMKTEKAKKRKDEASEHTNIHKHTMLDILKNPKPAKSLKAIGKRIRTHKVQYDTDVEIRNAVLQFLIYVIFLICSMFVINSVGSTNNYYLNKICQNFLIDYNATITVTKHIKFRDISTIAQIYEFLYYNFVYNYNFEEWSRNFTQTPQKYFMTENLVLGCARIRQIRTKPTVCYHNHINFTTCYSEYHHNNHDDSGYKGYPIATDFNYVWGEVHLYLQGGYVQDLYGTAENQQRIIVMLHEDDWIDRGTRCVVFEFNIYNEAIDSFASIKLIFEVMPTGLVFPTYKIVVFPRETFFSDSTSHVFYFCMVFFIIILYYTYVEVNEMIARGFKSYASHFLNYFDSLNILSSYIVLGHNFLHCYLINNAQLAFVKNPSQYLNLDSIVEGWRFYINVMGLMSFLNWFKILHFLTFYGTLIQFSITLKKCARDVGYFILIFVVLLLGFAQLGNIAFGLYLRDFSSISDSLITVILIIMSNFKFEQLWLVNHTIAAIFLVALILTLFLIFLNVFLAIIISTYVDVKQSNLHYVEETVILKRIRAVIGRLICFWRPAKQDEAAFDAINPQIDEEDKSKNKKEKVEEESPVHLQWDDQGMKPASPEEIRDSIAHLHERAVKVEINLESMLKSMVYIQEHLNEKSQKDSVVTQLKDYYQTIKN